MSHVHIYCSNPLYFWSQRSFWNSSCRINRNFDRIPEILTVSYPETNLTKTQAKTHVLIRFISEFFSFVQRHPECIKWLIALGACSAFGQYFIFSIVTTFGPLWCSIVTTTRKFFTILFSVMYFGNALSSQQWAGSLLVFAGLALDGYLSTRQPQTKQQPRKKAE